MQELESQNASLTQARAELQRQLAERDGEVAQLRGVCEQEAEKLGEMQRQIERDTASERDLSVELKAQQAELTASRQQYSGGRESMCQDLLGACRFGLLC